MAMAANPPHHRGRRTPTRSGIGIGPAPPSLARRRHATANTRPNATAHRLRLRLRLRALESRTERIIRDLADEAEAEAAAAEAAADASVALQVELDALYEDVFSEVAAARDLDIRSAGDFAALARDDPGAFRALVAALREDHAEDWKTLQERSHQIKLRQRALDEAADGRRAATAPGTPAAATPPAPATPATPATPGSRPVRAVLVCGFESFNVSLYRRAAAVLASTSSDRIQLSVFSDADVSSRFDDVASALAGADVFLGSLLFDYDQVQSLVPLIAPIKIRLCFESDLALMQQTRVGAFAFASPPPPAEEKGKGKAAPSPSPPKASGPPPAVKKILSLFGSGREEDRIVGYLGLLKLAPKLLAFVPGTKAKDLRAWLQVSPSH